MSDVFESIKTDLTEAIEFANNKNIQAVVHELTSIDVKEIRKNVGMTQMEFATAFGISLSTLRHWERGDRKPSGPALVLLNIVSREPDAVLRALSVAE